MDLYEYLNSLGNTPDEIAASLKAQGVKGKKGSPCFCPILNGIYQKIHIWSGLRIMNGNKFNGHWHYRVTYGDSQISDPTFSQPIMDFIGKFDSGEYPDLECEEVKEVTTRVWK